MTNKSESFYLSLDSRFYVSVNNFQGHPTVSINTGKNTCGKAELTNEETDRLIELLKEMKTDD